MSYRKHLKKLGNALIDLVFPIYCVVCRKERQSFLCQDCLQGLPKQKQQCIVCGKISPFGKTHVECVSKNTIDGFLAALPYSHPDVKKTIFAYKFHFVKTLAKPLTQILTETIEKESMKEFFSDFKISPVPLHKNRLNWRGFNQAELIAQDLAEYLDIPLVRNLLRVRNTTPQSDLKKEKRKINIENAFALSRAATGQKYLLVDDVATTGATLNEIAKILKKEGSPQVWAAVVAHGD